jgi:hypothetical protein
MTADEQVLPEELASIRASIKELQGEQIQFIHPDFAAVATARSPRSRHLGIKVSYKQFRSALDEVWSSS